MTEEVRRNLHTGQRRERLQALAGQVERGGGAPVNLACPLPLPEKDRPVLLAALAARATHLLTGDLRHFGRYFEQTVGSVRIVPPGAHLAGE